MRVTQALCGVAALSLVGAASVGVAHGATAEDGRIAFNSYKSGDGDIYVINADGTGEVNVTGDQPRGEGHDDQGPDWSPDGTEIAFTRYRHLEGADIYLINPDGTGLRPVTEENGTFEHPISNSQPDWKPDGSSMAFSSDRDGNLEVWEVDPGGSNVTQLTETPAPRRNFQPTWSADASKIAFISDRDGGQQHVYVMDADGSDPVNVTSNAPSDVSHWDPTWSPDGDRIAYTRSHRESTPDGTEVRSDIWISDSTGGNPVNLTLSDALEFDPVFSPDGTEISFVRQNPGGGTDVWVMPLPSATTTDVAAKALTVSSPRAHNAEVAGATRLTRDGTASDPDWSSSLAPTLSCRGLAADNPPSTGLVLGTPNDDVLVGSSAHNTFKGRGGNDTICGGGGRDDIFGGDGHDRLAGQGDQDTLYGAGGRDRLSGGTASDTCLGGPGKDAALNCEYRSSIP